MSGSEEQRGGARILTLGALAAVAVAAGGYLAWSGGAQAEGGQTAITPPARDIVLAQTDTADAGDAAADEDPLVAAGYAIGDIPLGSPDAPVTVIEYVSLTCPHCRTFHEGPYPEIKERYVDTGQVRFIVRELYGDRAGLFASAIARCAGPDRFHAFLDVIFERQPVWATSATFEDLLSELRGIGRLGGLSDARIDECLNDEDYLRALFSTAQEHLARDEVPATPYFLINGEPIRGAASLEQMSAALDEALAQ